MSVPVQLWENQIFQPLNFNDWEVDDLKLFPNFSPTHVFFWCVPNWTNFIPLEAWWEGLEKITSGKNIYRAIDFPFQMLIMANQGWHSHWCPHSISSMQWAARQYPEMKFLWEKEGLLFVWSRVEPSQKKWYSEGKEEGLLCLKGGWLEISSTRITYCIVIILIGIIAIINNSINIAIIIIIARAEALQ